MPLQAWLVRMLRWSPTEINLIPVPNVLDMHPVVNNVARPFPTAFNWRTTHVLWTLEGSAIRVTFDGSDPVIGANGHILAVGATGVWPVQMAQVCRYISDTAANGAFHLTQLYGR